MKGAFLALALLALPARAETLAVEATGELPGFETADAWLAQQMELAALPGWHFAARDRGRAAPDRVEWRFELLPYAGGGVRQFFPQAGAAAALKARHLVSAQARLYLHGQYQTVVFGQEAVAGGSDDRALAGFVVRTTRSLQDAWQATEVAEPAAKR
jgi:hypothetical protein